MIDASDLYEWSVDFRFGRGYGGGKGEDENGVTS